MEILLPMFLALLVLMIFSVRKQKKMMAAQQELQDSLKPGDRVMTTSGLYGTVADASDDTTIDVEIADGVVTTWLRQAIREKVGPVIEDDAELTDTDADDTTEVEASADEADERAEKTEGAQVAPPLEHGTK
nr:preprotein translocase subunit YajC [Thermocrispum municipale]